MLCQQLFVEKYKGNKNNSISEACSIFLNMKNEHTPMKDNLLREKGRRKPINLIGKYKETTNVIYWYQRASYVKFSEESDSEVKRRTNFSSDKEMIAYAILICNTD